MKIRNFLFFAMCLLLVVCGAYASGGEYIIVDVSDTACESLMHQDCGSNSGDCESSDGNLPTDCLGRDNKTYALIDKTEGCGSWTETTGLYNCTSCPSDYTLVDMSDLRNLNVGVDFIVDSEFEAIYGGLTTASLIDNNENVSVCLHCVSKPVPGGGTWQTYNTTNKSVSRTSCVEKCLETICDEVEYGCAANTCYVSGSGASIVCRALGTGEVLGTGGNSDGHTSACTCDTANNYTLVNGACVKCDPATGHIMHNGSCICDYNAGYYKSGDSCARCPAQSGVQGLSIINSTSKSDCYIPMSEAHNMSDDTGTYEFVRSCNYCEQRCETNSECIQYGKTTCDSETKCCTGSCSTVICTTDAGCQQQNYTTCNQTTNCCEGMCNSGVFCLSSSDCVSRGYPSCINGCCSGSCGSSSKICSTALDCTYYSSGCVNNCCAGYYCPAGYGSCDEDLECGPDTKLWHYSCNLNTHCCEREANNTNLCNYKSCTDSSDCDTGYECNRNGCCELLANQEQCSPVCPNSAWCRNKNSNKPFCNETTGCCTAVPTALDERH